MRMMSSLQQPLDMRAGQAAWCLSSKDDFRTFS